jgi:outer membrane protein TolC
MKYKLLISGLLILSFSAIMAQENLTLQQAIEIALANNFSIKIAKNNQQISENNHTTGNAGMLPVVTAGGQAGNTSFFINEQKRFLTDKKGADSTTTTSYNGKTNTTASANITLNWTIFNGMGMYATYQRLAELQAIGQENTKITIENTIAAVSSTYFNVKEQINRIRVLKEAIKISAQRLKLAKDKYEVGTGAKQDYLSAQVDYNADQSALISQEQQLEIVKISLNQLLNRPANTNFIAQDSLMVTKTLSLSELTNFVLQQNPQLLVAQHQKNAAYLNIRELQAQRFPVVGIFAGLNENYAKSRANIFPNGFNSTGLNYGISASIPIFNGNNLNRQIQNAKINEQSAQYQIEDIKTQLLADLEQTFLQYDNSLKLAELERENLKLAQQNEEIALERYKAGATTSLELREVQRNAVATESRLIDALFNAKLAEIELLRLSSKIVE